MNNPQRQLSPEEIDTAGLTGWHRTDDTIQATFQTGDFATGLELVNKIGASSESANHHPDIVLTYPSVEVTLTSHDVGGLTNRDTDLARLIDGHAEALGVPHATG